MIDFEQKVSTFWMNDLSSVKPFLGARFDYATLPIEHKDQIHYLNVEGTAFIREWMRSSKMFSTMLHLGGNPFNVEYFKSIELNTNINWDNEQIIKKWLFNKSIPFAKYVFLDSVERDYILMLTWKMVIKYWNKLFWAEDVIVCDSSLTWCLFYYHHDQFYFGKDVHFDKEKEYQKTMELTRIVNEWNSKILPPT